MISLTPSEVFPRARVEDGEADYIVQPVFVLFELDPFVFRYGDGGALHGLGGVSVFDALKVEEERILPLVRLKPAHLPAFHGLARQRYVELFHPDEALREVRQRYQEHISADSVRGGYFAYLAPSFERRISLL